MLPFAVVGVAVACGGEPGATFTSRGEVQVYWNDNETWARSPFNRVAAPADDVAAVEWRPDLAWRFGGCDGVAKPRLLSEHDDGRVRTHGWLNEGWARFRPGGDVCIQIGREALLWGPATFWNPSDPFFSENNRANPQRELGGKDFVRARWQWSRAWSVSAIAQVGRGVADTGPAHCGAVKVDWVGNAASAAGVLAAEPHGRAGAYGWAQWTASDAVLLYAEAAWSEGQTATLPVADAGPTGWRIEARERTGRTAKVLVGGTYTFANAWSVALECWNNGDGLADAEVATTGRAVDALGQSALGLADSQLGALLGGTAAPWRRHYIGVQLMNGGEARTGWLWRYARNLDDGSGEFVAQVSRTLAGDRVKVWLNVMARHGAPPTEYGRWARAGATAGFTWYVW